MKLIAIRDFRNNCELEIKDATHEHHVHKGAIFNIGGDVPYEKLNKADKELVALLNAANCVSDATDEKIVKQVQAEIAADKKAAEAKAKTAPPSK